MNTFAVYKTGYLTGRLCEGYELLREVMTIPPPRTPARLSSSSASSSLRILSVLAISEILITISFKLEALLLPLFFYC